MSMAWIRASSPPAHGRIARRRAHGGAGRVQPRAPNRRCSQLPPDSGYRTMLEQFSKSCSTTAPRPSSSRSGWAADEWSAAYGVRNMASPARPRSRTRSLGGITKSMVAVCVLKLAEEGRAGAGRARQHLPAEFNKVMHPPGPVTVRQLLQHRSGMPSVDGPLFDPATVRRGPDHQR